MPAALHSKDEVLSRLLETFRANGYDGASLSDLGAVTGLGKSSLYHHFPGGKADMANQVLLSLSESLEKNVFAPLQDARPPAKKLAAFLDALDSFYDGGKKACLLERLTASVDRKSFERPLARAFTTWRDAVEALAREAGLSKSVAAARAEDLVIRIEGALIMAAGTSDPDVFKRTLAGLKKSFLEP